MRCLRDAVAPDETACSLVCVVDDVRVDGCEGVEGFSSLLREHVQHSAIDKTHARKTVLVAGAVCPKHHNLPRYAVYAVNMHRDPYGWLAAGLNKTNENKANEHNDTPPRLGDVGSVAAAVHHALGGDSNDRHADDVDDDHHDNDDSTSMSNRNNQTDAAKTKAARGKRSGLWGRAPRACADTLVALDCIAELIHASGLHNTLALIESIRGDPRVCAVVAYHRGGSSSILGPENGNKSQVMAAKALRAAASCHVSVTLSNAVQSDFLVNKSSMDDSEYFESIDRTHLAAINAEHSNVPFCEIETTVTKPTGRSRGEREAVYGSLKTNTHTNVGTALSLTFSAVTVDKAGTPKKTENEKEKHSRSAAEIKAEALSKKLQAAVPFNLGVSESESKARAAVVLPFEHQGRGGNEVSSDSSYAKGDFLSYLPRDAGGLGGKTGKGHGENKNKGSGQIIYVRDSDDDGDGSPPDSDEELDEEADF